MCKEERHGIIEIDFIWELEASSASLPNSHFSKLGKLPRKSVSKLGKDDDVSSTTPKNSAPISSRSYMDISFST